MYVAGVAGCYGQLPLHKACRYSNSSVAVQQLIAANNDALTIGDGDGDMALHMACYNETDAAEAIIKVVLEAEPYVSRVAGQDDELPLHKAIQFGQSSVVVQLLKDASSRFAEVCRPCS